jgi:hypothetical protein
MVAVVAVILRLWLCILLLLFLQPAKKKTRDRGGSLTAKVKWTDNN